MSGFLTEPSRKLPVSHRCNVVVAGGGIAGVAAAISAARTGASVTLVEKQCLLGGLATSGLVTLYLPLCDGLGNQLSFGIAEELLHLSILHGAQEMYPDAWLNGHDIKARRAQRYEVQFNPYYFAIEMEQLLLREGVQISYDTRICDVHMEDRRVTSIIVENQDGRCVIQTGAAVDATGDALLLQRAGAATRPNEKGNKVAGWYYAFTPEKPKLTMLGFSDFVPGTERNFSSSSSEKRFMAQTAKDISDYLIASHASTLSHALMQVQKDKRFELMDIVNMPQFRMTRCLCGEYEMTESDDGKPQDDSVGMIGDWRKKGPRFEVPFSALCADQLENIFAAGRCISADNAMWDISRAIPACSVTGQAAGAAAALSANGSRTAVDELQKALYTAGQKLHFTDLANE